MYLSKENGFDFLGRIRLDDESIKALYPEFLLETEYQKISPTYLKWKKENEENGIIQADFCKKYGLEYRYFYLTCKKEAESLCKKQYEELQRRFDAFVKEHKDEIYRVQIEAIKASEKANKEADEEQEKERELKRKNARFDYEQSLIQYRNGRDIALSTLKENNNLNLINQLLNLGYSVKCASASMVFLNWEREENPSMFELEKIFPFEYEEPLIDRRGKITMHMHCKTKPVCGVVIDSDYHLLGYDYPNISSDQLVF